MRQKFVAKIVPLDMRAYLVIVVISVVLTVGCSVGTTVSLKDPVSGTPVEAVRVECYRRVSGAGKVLNPVGAFYHPIRLMSSGFTDSRGAISFSKSTIRDIYVVYPPNARALLVTVWGKTIEVAPPVEETNSSKWTYSVWVEGESLKMSATKVE